MKLQWMSEISSKISHGATNDQRSEEAQYLSSAERREETRVCIKEAFV